ncbi:hypothetical protein Tco_0796884 [Tanacetum coccineum]
MSFCAVSRNCGYCGVVRVCDGRGLLIGLDIDDWDEVWSIEQQIASILEPAQNSSSTEDSLSSIIRVKNSQQKHFDVCPKLLLLQCLSIYELVGYSLEKSFLSTNIVGTGQSASYRFFFVSLRFLICLRAFVVQEGTTTSRVVSEGSPCGS